MHLTQIVRVGDTMGGIAQVARQYHYLAQALDDTSQPVQLTTLVDSPRKLFESHFADIGAIHAPRCTRSIGQFSPTSLARFSKTLHQSDAILAHTDTCRAALRLLGALSISRRIPMIGIGHNDNRIRKAKRYDGMICLTPCQAQRINAEHGYFPTQVVPNPLGASDFPDTSFASKLDQLSATRAHIGVACNLIPKKNVSRILKEFAHLLQITSHPDIWRLSIAGDGSERPALEALAQQLNIRDKVSFHGWIDASQRAHFFSDIDILWHTSKLEPFGLVLVEGAYYGCHVQVSRTAGSNAIAQPDGIPELQLIEQDSPIGLLAMMALERMKSLDNRRTDLVLARQHALDAYAPTALAPRWRKVIQQFINTYQTPSL